MTFPISITSISRLSLLVTHRHRCSRFSIQHTVYWPQNCWNQSFSSSCQNIWIDPFLNFLKSRYSEDIATRNPLMYERNIYFTRKLSRSMEVWVGSPRRLTHLNLLIILKDFRNCLRNDFAYSNTSYQLHKMTNFESCLFFIHQYK